jgi:hypothetical protein
MLIEDVSATPPTAPEFTDEQIKYLWPQAYGELQGFANAIGRGPAKITASQLRMAIQLAQRAFTALAVLMVIFCLTPSVSAQQGKLKPYEMRLKTKSGSNINAKIMARDPGEAEYKLQKRYPNHTILNFKPKPVIRHRLTVRSKVKKK